MPLKRGFLVILSGPSGAGKNTVLDATMDRCSDLQYSVSATTRPRRKSEQDGVDYFFLTEEEFQRRVRAGEFLEWAEFCGHSYGTPLAYIEECLEQGHVVVMDIDIEGARQVKDKMPEAVFVFLLPPTMAELENRLRGRSTDSDEAIRQRLGKALEELKAGIDYDYVILNDKIAKSAAKLEAIITAERCRVKHSEYFELLEDIVGRNRE
ncbi:MAG: guanylate kinase [Firmicutes bacterium]|nr:guanylate kinase [Bacillota bacterium]